MNLIEISNKFPTELSVIEYFEKNRWGTFSRCPYCNKLSLSKERQKDYRFFCNKCEKSYSVTINTTLHNTRLPLKTWLFAFAVVCDAKKGLSAKQLERHLGVHYETAWSMYHKIRELMIMENNGIEEMDNIVEMDETYIGPKRPRLPNSGIRGLNETRRLPEMDERINELKDEGFNFKAKRGNPAKVKDDIQSGRGTDKIPVVGIVERDGNVVAEVMKNTTYANLKEMVQKYVDEDNSVLITDEYIGYNRMSKIIEHITIEHKKYYSYRGINTNSIESFWAIIKRQIIGQHHHVSAKYLPNYIAETVFKYNNRKVDDMFETLVKNSMKEINNKKRPITN